jgi:hypothetical protein
LTKEDEDGYRDVTWSSSRYCGIVNAVCASPLKLEYDVQSMDDTRNVTENGQQNVDQEIGIAPALEEYT